MSNYNELVLVTGAGGYLALHVVDQFLKAGYKVRGTVRSLNDKSKVEPLRKLASEDKLELVEADLLKKETWPNALKNVTIVAHVASPFPMTQPSDENELIKPALDGTLNVLNAAFEADVKRVVLTSSCVCITGSIREERPYSEEDWADPNKQVAYGKSKILAERAAWNFVEEKKKFGQKCFELTVINPSLILGPTLHFEYTSIGTSEKKIIELLDGSQKKIQYWNVPVCDVRDVALAHVKAAFSSDAVGQRHAILTFPSYISFKEMADILREEFSSKGFTIPDEEEEKGYKSKLTSINNDRFVKVLGIEPTPIKKTLVDMVNSFIEIGIIKKPE